VRRLRIAQGAVAHLLPQRLLRGFCQIAKTTGQLEQFFRALLAVLGGESLPFQNRIDLHGQKYSAMRSALAFGNGVVSGLAVIRSEGSSEAQRPMTSAPNIVREMDFRECGGLRRRMTVASNETQ
jgi:hypothetical protein